MSALTVQDIAVHVRRRLGAPVAESLRYRPLVDEALKSLARCVARRDDFREFRKEIAVNCVAGIITIADGSVLFEMLAQSAQLVLNGSVAKAVPRYEDLTLKLPRDAYWFAVRNRKLYVADFPSGSLGTVAQTGTLEANCTLTLVEMPAAYDEELIAEVVRLAGGDARGAVVPPLEGDEGRGLNVSINDNH